MNAEFPKKRRREDRADPTQKKITVLIVDDQACVRDGVRRLLHCENDIEVIGEAENGKVGVRLAQKCQPDVILMDIAMPVLNGLEATRQIRKALPSARVLVLSSYDEDRQIKEAFEAGVVGYLLKQTDTAEIANAIREAHCGRSWINPTITRRYRKLFSDRISSRTTPPPTAGPTPPLL